MNLIADFEACRLDPRAFRHYDHIRLVWSYLGVSSREEAERCMRDGLKRLTAHVGARHKYHETMTVAWTRLVAWAVAVSPQANSFNEFLRYHGWLLESDAILRFYSRQRLIDDQARLTWLEPDLQPLPALGVSA